MRRLVVILIVIAALIGVFVLKTYRDAGQFKRIVPLPLDDVRVEAGVISSEDITIDTRTHIAYISSADRRALTQNKPQQPGAVFAYALQDTAAGVQRLEHDAPAEFHPHGIALFYENDSTLTLYAVNHNNDGHFIEIFEVAGEQLRHRKSISDPMMHSPNDVLVVAPERFYVTNDHGSAGEWGKTFEDYLQLNRSYVLYYDGHRFRQVAGGLAYANGINMSPDGSHVYVAATVDQAVYVYERNSTTGDLRFFERIKLGTGVDNLEVDESGTIWIGAHPQLLSFVKYANNPANLSPSHVLRVRPLAEGGYAIRNVFVDEGELLSGSSVAAYFDGWLLIGSVFDPRFLVSHLEGGF